MTKKVSTTNLAAAIMEQLVEYSDEVNEASKKAVETISKEVKAEIQKNSPTESGNYKKGWRVKASYETTTEKRNTVYNTKAPGLAHLLEFGHAKVNGGRTAAIPHIAPATEDLEERMKKEIQKNLK